MKKYHYMIGGCILWIVAFILTDRMYTFGGSVYVAIHKELIFRMLGITLFSAVGSRLIQKGFALARKKVAMQHSFFIWLVPSVAILSFQIFVVVRNASNASSLFSALIAHGGIFLVAFMLSGLCYRAIGNLGANQKCSANNTN